MANNSSIYNGSSWLKLKAIKIYNGSVWQTVTKGFIYTGTAWARFWPSAGPYTTTSPSIRLDSYTGKNVGSVIQMGPRLSSLENNTPPLTIADGATGTTYLWGQDGVWENNANAVIDRYFYYNSSNNFATASPINGVTDKLLNASGTIDSYDANYLWYYVKQTTNAVGEDQSDPLYIIKQKPVIPVSFLIDTSVDPVVDSPITLNYTLNTDWYRNAKLADSYIEWFAEDTLSPTYTTVLQTDYLSSNTGTKTFTPTSAEKDKYIFARITLANSYSDYYGSSFVTTDYDYTIYAVADNNPPGAFQITSFTKGYPGGSAPYYRSLNLAWTTSDFATYYKVQIQGSNDNSSWSDVQTFSTSAKYNKPTTSSSTSAMSYIYYRAAVEASNLGTTKTYNNYGTAGNLSYYYATGTEPGAPTIGTITPGTGSSYNTASVAYTATSSYGSSYYQGVQYSLDNVTWSSADFANPVVLSGLTGATNYTVYLRSLNGDGLSSSVVSKAFTTNASQVAPNGGTVSVSPSSGYTGDTFTASPSGWSGTPNTFTYSYSWRYLNSSLQFIQISTGSTFTPTTTYPYGTYLFWTVSNGVTPDATGTTSFTVNQQTYTRTLSFSANGGIGEPASINGTDSGSGATITIPNTVPTRDGYSFSYWNTSPTAIGTTYAPGNNITITSNVTLYAIWTLTLVAPSGGSVTVSPTSGTVGATFTASTSGWTGVPNSFTYAYSWEGLSRTSYSYVQLGTGSSFNSSGTNVSNYLDFRVAVTATNAAGSSTAYAYFTLNAAVSPVTPPVNPPVNPPVVPPVVPPPVTPPVFPSGGSPVVPPVTPPVNPPVVPPVVPPPVTPPVYPPGGSPVIPPVVPPVKPPVTPPVFPSGPARPV